MTTLQQVPPVSPAAFRLGGRFATGFSQPVQSGDVGYSPLCGGIIALALVAGLNVAATVAMTVTTAANIAWPDVAFRCLAAALVAALIFAHARRFSSANAAFAAGIICGIVPSLLIAAHHNIDHWDDFMTWLGNALYVWKFGAFPSAAAPPVASVWPGYPPGSSMILAAVWSAAGRVIETAGPVINVVCLAVLPGIALRAVGSNTPRDVTSNALLGVVLGLAVTLLNVGLDWHWVLSSLPETAMLVAFAAAFVLASEMRFRRGALPRSHFAALAVILALIVNLKQTGFIVAGLLVLASLLLNWTWPDGKRRWLRPLSTFALVCVPCLAVWLCWQFYRVNIYPGEAFAFRTIDEWNFVALPDFLHAAGRSVKEHWLFFVPVSAVVLRGWYVFGRRWLTGDTAISRADRLAVLFALVESGYLAFLFLCYLGAFTEKEARGAVEFFRYQSTLGAAGLIAASALIMERLKRPLPIAALAATLAVQIAIAFAILPSAGIHPGKAIYGPTEVAQLRQIGRTAGEMIARSGDRVTVEFAHNDGYLAVLIVRYDIWARAPLLVRGISGNWAGDQLPARFAAARPSAPFALALENQDGSHCAVLGSGMKLELIGSPAQLPTCRPLLSRLRRMDDRSTVGSSF